MPIHIPVRDFAEEFAESIKKVDEAMQSIASAGVKQETLVTLIKDKYGTRINKDDIRAVLNTLGQLKSIYLTEEKKK